MLNNFRNTLRTVNIERQKLLTAITENLEKHVSEYNDNVKDYREACKKIIAENAVIDVSVLSLSEIAKKFKKLPPEPTSYEQYYKKAIKMLEFSADEVIQLDADVFNQLVLDEWEWKSSFDLTASTYKSIIG